MAGPSHQKTWFKGILTALLALCVFAVSAYAGSQLFRGDVTFKNANVNVTRSSKMTFASGTTLDISSATVTSALGASQISNRTRYLYLPVSGFLLTADGTDPASATADPERVVVNNSEVLEWEQSETGKVGQSFVVPADYASGATFICLVKLDATSSDTTLDWEIFVQVAAAAPDSAATNQTPAAVADDTTNVQAISLATATDTFAAGNIVTFNVWRAAGTGASSDLNLFGCYLSYTADM